MSVLALSTENFQKEVMSSEKPVLIDFWASWCGPCRMLSPTVDEISEEEKDRIKVCKVNVDEQPDLAEQFNVMSIPTLVVIKNGKVTSTSVGVRSKSDILNMLNG